MAQIVLSDQKSFNDFFVKFLEGSISDSDTICLAEQKIDAPPFLDVKGDDYHCTVDALTIDVLLSYQRNVNRLYSLILHGKTQKLSDEDLKKVRFVFGVKDGSSIIDSLNSEKVLEAIVSNLSGVQITALVALGLMLYFTYNGAKYYLDKKYTQKDKELILRVIREVKGGNELLDGHKEFSSKLKKLSKAAEAVEYSGYKIDTEFENVDEKLISHKQLNGAYRILKLDAENDSYFKVRIENISTGNKFNAKLDQIISQQADLEMMYRAIFNRKDVHLFINARFIDNRLVDAFVVSISENATQAVE